MARFAHDCAHCARRISMKIWPTVHYLLLHIVTYMLQRSKMQGEARNREKRRFGALRARLCALRAQDQLENLTNCPLLIATHSDFYASTLKNARGSQKSRKETFWRASRAIARAACARSGCKTICTSVFNRRTFGPSFVALRQFVLPLLPCTISERR